MFNLKLGEGRNGCGEEGDWLCRSCKICLPAMMVPVDSLSGGSDGSSTLGVDVGRRIEYVGMFSMQSSTVVKKLDEEGIPRSLGSTAVSVSQR